MKEEVIARGAEALLIHVDGKLIKRRISKGYRLKELDESLRKKRTRIEGRLLEKVARIINVPKIYKIDENKKEIVMNFLQGKKLSEHLDKFNLSKSIEICEKIGKNIAKLHEADIIHGDLTTSNMILKKNKGEFDNRENQRFSGPRKSKDFLGEKQRFSLFFIDFGLGFHSNKIEDKAVDLHLLKEALKSKHYRRWEKYFNSVLKGYTEYKEHEKVLKQLGKVELRGRYKGH